MDKPEPTTGRRRFLRTGAGVVAAGLIAGCAGGSAGNDSENNSSTSSGPANDATQSGTQRTQANGSTQTSGQGSYSVSMKPVGSVTFDADTFREQIIQPMANHPIGSQVTAVQNEQIYPGGVGEQGPVTNLYNTELLARQLYPDEFGSFSLDSPLQVSDGDALFSREGGLHPHHRRQLTTRRPGTDSLASMDVRVLSDIRGQRDTAENSPPLSLDDRSVRPDGDVGAGRVVDGDPR